MEKETYSDLVYKDKGPYSRSGGTYDFKGVYSKEEHEAALKDGWFNTMPEAIAGKSSLVEVADTKPPTRVELEQKAKELSIKFSKSTTDEQLAAAIDKALGA